MQKPDDNNQEEAARKIEANIRPEVAEIVRYVERIIKSKRGVTLIALAAILSRGHVLFEDVPGTGKTTLASLLANSLDLSFAHVQMTSDMLPSDILGSMIFDPDKRKFEFHPGPIFANVIMADELNRTSPRTQSALLEAMGAASVTVDRQTHKLPQPFIVLATQNPREIHGTYPLPTSQLDRFLVRLHMGYPDPQSEATILREQQTFYAEQSEIQNAKPVFNTERLIQIQNEITQIKVDQTLIDAIIRLANATRNSKRLELGLSTRAALGLRRMAQAWAWMQNRDYIIPDDIKQLVIPVCAHRIITTHRFNTTETNTQNTTHTPEETAMQQILSEFTWEW
ncbi:MAG: MoxR family ATPase [Candidatus Sumerlaeales bacterium]|nr:MoxR family ATPase [Candidatus Sumerlaeales bacterium]